MKKFINFLKIPIFLTAYQILIYFLTKLFAFNPTLLKSNIDNDIPFTAYFIYFYIVWYLMLFLVPYLYHIYDKKILDKYVISNLISVFISGVIFIIFPTTINRINIESKNFTLILVNFIYWMDNPPVNCLPSIHSLISFLFIFYTLKSKLPGIYKIIINALSILVIASTLFIKQHVIYDALLSFIIAYIIYKIIIKKEFKFSFQSFLRMKR